MGARAPQESFVFRLRRRPDEGSMLYNKRTVQKLERWYNYCSFKPIHVVILEQFHTQLWHVHDFGKDADAIRRERDTTWWESVKDVTTLKRKREDKHAHRHIAMS